MRVQWEKLSWIALAIVLIVVGCGPSATQVPPTSAPTPVPPTQTPAPAATIALAFPTGVFTKANLTWEFKPDGTYHWQQGASGEADWSGVYTVTGNQIVTKDDSSCKDAVATYDWSYDGEVLSIKPVDDKCRDRANMSWGEWRKEP